MKKKAQLNFIIILLSCLNLIIAQAPLESVRKVADKIINETTFEFFTKAQEKEIGLQIVNLPDAESNKVLFAHSVINSKQNINATLGLSFTQPVEVCVNGKIVFTSDRSLNTFEVVAYDMYKFSAEFSVDLIEGENSILIKTFTGDKDYFALAAIDEHGMLNENVKFNLPVLNEDQNQFHKWLFLGPFENDNSELKAITDIKPYYKIDGKFYSWYLPITNTILDDVIKKDFSFAKHSYFEWHYANGQMLLGMLNLADLTSDQKYSAHIKKFCDFTLDNFDYFKYQYQVLNERGGFNHRLFRGTMLDDTGGPALPFIELTLRGDLNNARTLVDTIAEYISRGQSRLPDGTLCRPEPRQWTVWADDLFMSVPFLLRYAKLTGEDKYYDDGANQILLFYEKLFDKEINLYYHGWFSDTEENSAAHWGRANGWVIWAISEALLYLPKEHDKYGEILSIYKKHVDGLVKYQGDSGMWHQVIDKPGFYEETSSSAMFTLGIARGVLNGWLDKNYKDAAIKGWNAISKKIDDNGTVTGICRGTGIGFDLDFYYSRETPPNDPRGLGAVLTAGAEVAKLLTEGEK